MFCLQLIAIWLMTRWQAHGQPKKIRLLELGPGRGTLMVDILRVRTVLLPTPSNDRRLIDRPLTV